MRATRSLTSKREPSEGADPRVLIAMDVLARLQALRWTRGTYMEMPWSVRRGMEEARDLSFYLPELESCKVCALGGMMISFINLHDNIKVDELFSGYCLNNYGNDDVMRERLGRYFTTEQLDLIESAFERTSMVSDARARLGYDDDFNVILPEPFNSRMRAAVAFGRRFRSSCSRVKAIMTNVIVNDGEFKPEGYIDRKRKLVATGGGARRDRA